MRNPQRNKSTCPLSTELCRLQMPEFHQDGHIIATYASEMQGKLRKLPSNHAAVIKGGDRLENFISHYLSK